MSHEIAASISALIEILSPSGSETPGNFQDAGFPTLTACSGTAPPNVGAEFKKSVLTTNVNPEFLTLPSAVVATTRNSKSLFASEKLSPFKVTVFLVASYLRNFGYVVGAEAPGETFSRVIESVYLQFEGDQEKVGSS